jgi:hypothetical protein
MEERPMQISVVNHTNGRVADDELQRVIRAINRQITEDFAPYWGMSATLRLEGRSAQRPDTIQIPDLRGDAVIYLWNETDVDGALGYHEKNARGVPFGFVFTEISQSIDEPWSVTFSHEALELIGDPETNLLVMGPHPSEDRDVFHWFEMCDAVQNETYEIDGVPVSNFVLPLYFTGTRNIDEIGARNDFLGQSHDGQTLKSFGINPGGYIGFFDPDLGDHDTFSIQADAVALMRMQQKSRAKETRRAVRYRNFAQRNKLRAPAKSGANSRKKSGAKALTGESKAAAKNRVYASVSANGSKKGLKSARGTGTVSRLRKPRRQPSRSK